VTPRVDWGETALLVTAVSMTAVLVYLLAVGLLGRVPVDDRAEGPTPDPNAEADADDDGVPEPEVRLRPWAGWDPSDPRE
jgi:hypothetical protein